MKSIEQADGDSREEPITEVCPDPDGKGWTINCDAMCLWLGANPKDGNPAETWGPPQVGDTARFWGDFGRPVRGVALRTPAGPWRVVYYRTPTEHAAFCEQIAEAARRDLERMRIESVAAIATAQVPTEAEMREATAPTPKTSDELAEYVRGLVDRPHDYGTCCYAMSLAATAAFNFVASHLGATGFQASCADLDVLRRLRGLDRFRITDYGNLLYPQYCDAEHFPSAADLITHPDVRPWLAEQARKELAEHGDAHPDVRRHWRMLADWKAAA